MSYDKVVFNICHTISYHTLVTLPSPPPLPSPAFNSHVCQRQDVIQTSCFAQRDLCVLSAFPEGLAHLGPRQHAYTLTPPLGTAPAIQPGRRGPDQTFRSNTLFRNVEKRLRMLNIW